MAQGRKMPAAKVIERDKLFVKALIAFRFNATQAAIAVGVAPVSASTEGHKLSRKAEVQELLAVEIDALAARHDLTIDSVVMELKKIGFSNIEDYTRLGENGLRFIDFSGSTRDQLAAVESFTIKETVLQTTDTSDEDGELIGRERTVKREMKLALHDKKGALVTLLEYLTTGKAAAESSGMPITNNFNLTQVNVTQADAINEYTKMIRGEG